MVSWDAEASLEPSGENVTEVNVLKCPSTVVMRAPLAVSRSCIDPSSDTMASIVPSGEKVTDMTEPPSEAM